MKNEIIAAVVLVFGLIAVQGCGKSPTAKKNVSAKNSAAQQKQSQQSSDRAVKAGDKVAVNYIGTFTNGKKFDSSYDRGKPIEFTVGAGQMIKGFDKAVIGMKPGEEKKVTLKPADAYGERNEKYKTEIPKKNFPKDYKLKKGGSVPLSGPGGRRINGTILEVKKDAVVIDLNNPMAGKTLVFDIKLVKINVKDNLQK